MGFKVGLVFKIETVEWCWSSNGKRYLVPGFCIILDDEKYYFTSGFTVLLL